MYVHCFVHMLILRERRRALSASPVSGTLEHDAAGPIRVGDRVDPPGRRAAQVEPIVTVSGRADDLPPLVIDRGEKAQAFGPNRFDSATVDGFAELVPDVVHRLVEPRPVADALDVQSQFGRRATADAFD